MSVIAENRHGARSDLKLPAKEARDFLDAIAAQKGLLYGYVVSRLLVDGQATRAAVLDGLAWLRQRATAQDVVMPLPPRRPRPQPGGRLMLRPRGPRPRRPAPDRRALVGGAPDRGVRARPLLFFVDTCHAGDVLGTRRSSDINSAANPAAPAPSTAPSSSPPPPAARPRSRTGLRNGAFARALVECLAGRADPATAAASP